MLSENLKIPISELDIAFLDVETTGLNPLVGDKICEVGILKIKDNKVTDTYETLINPGIDIPPSSTAIHGITNDMVEQSPYFKKNI